MCPTYQLLNGNIVPIDLNGIFPLTYALHSQTQTQRISRNKTKKKKPLEYLSSASTATYDRRIRVVLFVSIDRSVIIPTPVDYSIFNWDV